MARCSVRVLGGFEVRVDGEPLPADVWRTRRAADIVKVLALHPGHSLHREQVMEMLWPDLGEQAAAANLRKAVHHARRAIGTPDAITSHRAMLSLFDGDVDVDASRFLALVDAAEATGDRNAFARAALIYTGEALPGDRYELWAAEARDRLQARHIAALRGAELWRRILEVDPTDEEAHRALMQRHLEAGRRADALRQFGLMRQALREHIGVGPGPETIALYERVLAMEGAEPPTPAQRAAQLIATGLVALNAGNAAEAERLARAGRDIAFAERLGEELADASTVLALASVMSGRWHEAFQADFAESLKGDPELMREVVDAHLCFVEYFVSGVDGYSAREHAVDLLAQAKGARSLPGEAVARLMLGESLLLMGEFDTAARELERACELNRDAGTLCGLALTLEHLAEVDVVSGRPRRARTRLIEALDAARRSTMPSHLTVRVLGVQVLAAGDVRRSLEVVHEAEDSLARAGRVCQACSINFHVQATRACARAGDRTRAHNHLAAAERAAGLWRGGPWAAAVWEARAAIRLAEGDHAQAQALLREAADGFAGSGRPLDAARCRAAASPRPEALIPAPPAR